jgi:hypothetical protein
MKEEFLTAKGTKGGHVSAAQNGVTPYVSFTGKPPYPAGRTITVDDLSADYLTTKAIATHKTPAEINGEMVREKIAASVR